MTTFEQLLKPSFLHDLIQLPQEVQKKVTKAADFLRNDPRHPSLQVKDNEEPHETDDGPKTSQASEDVCRTCDLITLDRARPRCPLCTTDLIDIAHAQTGPLVFDNPDIAGEPSVIAEFVGLV